MISKGHNFRDSFDRLAAQSALLMKHSPAETNVVSDGLPWLRSNDAGQISHLAIYSTVWMFGRSVTKACYILSAETTPLFLFKYKSFLPISNHDLKSGQIKTENVSHFSSPEHKVLKVSFCDGPLSVVRPCVRASTISLNNISSETTHWILSKLHRNDPWVVP